MQVFVVPPVANQQHDSIPVQDPFTNNTGTSISRLIR
jgi:hypothetical protein